MRYPDRYSRSGFLFALKRLFARYCPKENKIENGDTITVSIEYDKDLTETYGFKLSPEKLSLKVKGLEKGKEIDIFEGVEVELEGVSPMGTTTITSNNKYELPLKFFVSPNEFLKNGDEIELQTYLSEKNVDLAIAELGYKAKQYKKDIKVENLPEYVNCNTKFTEHMKDEVEKKIIDNYKKEFSEYRDLNDIKNIEIVSLHLCVNQNYDLNSNLLPDITPIYNQIIAVLKVTTNHEFYCYLGLKNVYFDKDETIVVESYYGSTPTFSSEDGVFEYAIGNQDNYEIVQID